MAYLYFNSNPMGNRVGDCTIRAISALTDQSWDDTYMGLSMQGFMDKDMPSSNSVWDAYLRSLGYKKYIVPNTCPDCITVGEFADDHSKGRYLLATGSHVIAVIEGNYYDTWDSGQEKPMYYYTKEEEE